MWLDDLNELVGTLKERIEQHKDVLSKNETATRYALIDPLLTALGWDLSDPRQVQTEYSIGDGRADYAMLSGRNTPEIVIEAKKLDRPISDGIKQSISYCTEDGIKYFVVTNGRDWAAYETHKVVPVTDKQIIDFSLTDPTRPTVMKMLWLWRGNFESESPIVPVVPDRPVSQQAATSAPQPAAAAPPPSVQQPDRGIPLDEFSPGKGPPPAALLFSGGTKKSIAKWYEMQTLVVQWLIDTERLTEADCPVEGSGGGHLVSTSPVKRDGNKFGIPKQIGRFYVDAEAAAARHINIAKAILKARNVNPSDVRVVERT